MQKCGMKMKILNAVQIQEQELSALLSSGEDGIRQRAPVSFQACYLFRRRPSSETRASTWEMLSRSLPMATS
jgi:hypothetical protein